MKKVFSSVLSVIISMALTAGVSTVPCTVAVENEETSSVVSETEGLSLGTQDQPTMEEILGEEVCFDQETAYLKLMENVPKMLSNDSPDAYNFGEFLDSNNRAVYDAVKKLVEPSVSNIEIDLPEPITVNLSKPFRYISTSEKDKAAYDEAVQGAFTAGVEAVLFDYPELFWLDQFNLQFAVRYEQRGNAFSGYKVIINGVLLKPAYFSGFESLEGVMDYRDRLEQAVLDFMPDEGLTRYDQLKQIEDKISEFTYYDEDAPFSSTAVGAIVEPGVVCEGYSEAFKLICDRLGIPCICVVGNIDHDNGSGHMWNYVQMEDGNWYGIDVTWDDVDGRNGKVVVYDNFLRGSEKFMKAHTPTDEFMNLELIYPVLAENDFDPYSVYETTTSVVTTEQVTTSSEQITTESETTSSEQITTESETTSSEEITTESETTSSEQITTESETTSSEEITTESETTSSEQITTESETTSSVIITTEPVYAHGDINHDNEVNIADLVYCIGTVLGKGDYKFSCDLNNDGIGNGYDVIIMRRILFG